MRWPASLRIAVGFLTRVPVGGAEFDDQSFGRALGWFAPVGLGIGGLLVLAQSLLLRVLPHGLASVLGVALWQAISGGLHLDGLADLSDGLSGGRGDRARTLEIMRDSRIGAHGAAVLTLFLLAKVAALDGAFACGQGFAVLACPAVARLTVAALVVSFPYAREEGLGLSFHRTARAVHLVWGALATLAALLACGTHAFAAALLSAPLVMLLGYALNRRLGGLTGDVYGAAIELGELAFLCVIASCS